VAFDTDAASTQPECVNGVEYCTAADEAAEEYDKLSPELYP